MRILVTGTRGVPDIMGGVETHCEELFPRIAAKGIDVTITRRANYVNDKLESWRGCVLVDIATPKRKSFEAIVHTWRSILYARRKKINIIHIHAIGPGLLTPIARILGLKVVFTHHGPDYDRDKWGSFAKFMLRLGERFACKYANEVIVISDVIKSLIAKKYGRTDHVHLIYNGVPQPNFCADLEYFKKLGINEDSYILAACRFVPEKNLHHLIEAFSGLNTNGFKLVLAGDSDFHDSYYLKLVELAKEKGVVLTGFVKGSKLHSLLTNCRAYCLPSSHEGLPIALLEAMSYKTQVVVSDIPANKEVGLDPQSYFKCGDVNELSAKLQHIIDSEPRKIDYNMAPYDWDVIANQVYQVFKSLV